MSLPLSLRVLAPVTLSVSRRNALQWGPALATVSFRTCLQNQNNSRYPGKWCSVRSYAKKTNNKKKNTPSAATADNDKSDDTVMLFDEKAINNKFGQAIQALKEQFSTLRIGRANPALLDTVKVYIEDVNFSLRDLAQVSIRDPQTLLVTVHDTEYQTAVDKGIREAGLNLNPVIDSKFIRVPIPKPTKDSRDKMAKVASQTAEQMKSRIRLVRQDGMKQLKTDAKSQSKDDIKKMEKLVQTMTDKYNKEVDELLKSKLKEIQS